MITDAQLRPSLSQNLAVAAGNVNSTNAVDLLSAGRNLGRGQPMRGIVTVNQTFTGGTSINVQFVESDNADLSSPRVLAQTGVIAEADIPTAGNGKPLWDFQLPDTARRYIGFRYVMAGTHTAGQVSAHFVSDTDHNPYVAMNTGF